MEGKEWVAKLSVPNIDLRLTWAVGLTAYLTYGLLSVPDLKLPNVGARLIDWVEWARGFTEFLYLMEGLWDGFG